LNKEEFEVSWRDVVGNYFAINRCQSLWFDSENFFPHFTSLKAKVDKHAQILLIIFLSQPLAPSTQHGHDPLR
jgi:hypothetical protein